MDDARYRRYIEINMPHARTVALRLAQTLEALIASSARNDRLGQHVRNPVECLGLAEEGRTLSLLCGESPDSALR